MTGRRVVRGALVSLGGSLGSRVLSFLALAVLARLLLPEDFGVMAVAMIFIGFARALMSRQFHLALIRLPEIERSHYDTAFTLSMIWGVGAAVALATLAGPLAIVMSTPEAAPVLRLMALALLLEGLQSPVFVRHERALDLRPEVIADWIAKLLQYGVSIGLALIWQSHWVLVLGFLAFTAGRVALSYVFGPYLPRPSLRHWRAFLSFGGWLTGTGIAGYAIGFTDVALVAARLGTGAVGIYNLTAEIVRMATDYMAMPLGRAVYPGLAAIADDPARMRLGLLRATQVLMGMMLPIGVGLALTAREIVLLLLGDDWLSGIAVIQILAPAAALSTVSYVAQSVMMARGQTRLMFLRNVIVATVQLPLIWVGIVMAGVAGAAAGRAMGMVLHGILSLTLAAPQAGLGRAKLLLAPWRSLAASAVMAAGLLWLETVLLTPAQISLGLVLVAKIVAGVVLYCGAHLALWVASGRPEGFEVFLLRRLVPALRPS